MLRRHTGTTQSMQMLNTRDFEMLLNIQVSDIKLTNRWRGRANADYGCGFCGGAEIAKVNGLERRDC